MNVGREVLPSSSKSLGERTNAMFRRIVFGIISGPRRPPHDICKVDQSKVGDLRYYVVLERSTDERKSPQMGRIVDGMQLESDVAFNNWKRNFEGKYKSLWVSSLGLTLRLKHSENHMWPTRILIGLFDPLVMVGSRMFDDRKSSHWWDEEISGMVGKWNDEDTKTHRRIWGSRYKMNAVFLHRTDDDASEGVRQSWTIARLFRRERLIWR